MSRSGDVPPDHRPPLADIVRKAEQTANRCLADLDFVLAVVLPELRWWTSSFWRDWPVEDLEVGARVALTCAAPCADWDGIASVLGQRHAVALLRDPAHRVRILRQHLDRMLKFVAANASFLRDARARFAGRKRVEAELAALQALRDEFERLPEPALVAILLAFRIGDALSKYTVAWRVGPIFRKMARIEDGSRTGAKKRRSSLGRELEREVAARLQRNGRLSRRDHAEMQRKFLGKDKYETKAALTKAIQRIAQRIEQRQKGP